MATIAPTTSRKKPVNLSLNETLVAQARLYTDNLSATLERLLKEFVMSQQAAQISRQQAADQCAEAWNALHGSVGSYADEHVRL
jgi:antitoxin CcdA